MLKNMKYKIGDKVVINVPGEYIKDGDFFSHSNGNNGVIVGIDQSILVRIEGKKIPLVYYIEDWLLPYNERLEKLNRIIEC